MTNRYKRLSLLINVFVWTFIISVCSYSIKYSASVESDAIIFEDKFIQHLKKSASYNYDGGGGSVGGGELYEDDEGNKYDQFASDKHNDLSKIFIDRFRLLRKTCTKYSDPFRPESSVINAPPRSLGVEVVYIQNIHKTPHQELSVCIPHKVGSHSWGVFSRNLSVTQNQPYDDNFEDWRDRAKNSIKVVVVRHPLERLLSVYRMIFEDWCDPKGILAKQWKNTVCSKDFLLNEERVLKQLNPKKIISRDINDNNDDKFSLNNFFETMFDNYQHSNDRYILKIWRQLKGNNQKLMTSSSSPERLEIKFTFSEFIRFLVNGTVDFASEPNVLNHKGLSYHWAPYWKECSLCSEITKPDYIIHMETFQRDLNYLAEKLAMKEEFLYFPHTHQQIENYHNREQFLKTYFGKITKNEVIELYEKYKLDHELFGYSPQKFIDMAL